MSQTSPETVPETEKMSQTESQNVPELTDEELDLSLEPKVMKSAKDKKKRRVHSGLRSHTSIFSRRTAPAVYLIHNC